LEGWRRSDLNQREYCELHGLPLKRFGNWRAKLKHEEPAPTGKLLYRRGGGLRHMSSHMTKEIVPPPSGYIPSARSAPPGARRRFSEADKRRIVEEACRPGASVSGVARQYGITARLLFRWKQELALAAKTETTFLPVTITDAPEQSAETPPSLPGPAPVIVERSPPGIEVELTGGRRVRFERDVDPETVRRLVTLLEGEAR
jgi:transposase-like protein